MQTPHTLCWTRLAVTRVGQAICRLLLLFAAACEVQAGRHRGQERQGPRKGQRGREECAVASGVTDTSGADNAVTEAVPVLSPPQAVSVTLMLRSTSKFCAPAGRLVQVTVTTTGVGVPTAVSRHNGVRHCQQEAEAAAAGLFSDLLNQHRSWAAAVASVGCGQGYGRLRISVGIRPGLKSACTGSLCVFAHLGSRPQHSRTRP